MSEYIFKDREIVCGCGVEFVWTAGEQKFMHELQAKGKIEVVQTPKRCSKCRIANKNRKAVGFH